METVSFFSLNLIEIEMNEVQWDNLIVGRDASEKQKDLKTLNFPWLALVVGHPPRTGWGTTNCLNEQINGGDLPLALSRWFILWIQRAENTTNNTLFHLVEKQKISGCL